MSDRPQSIIKTITDIKTKNLQVKVEQLQAKNQKLRDEELRLLQRVERLIIEKVALQAELEDLKSS